MEISKSLRRPSNWQDFETLCKKLWGEIWNSQEIKKNGRNGQVQFGVDVYGIPQGENEYFGIQCKGKGEYTNKQFTEKEIEEEISKALHFKPKLKKFYLATTAVKDVNIEQFVREKNIEHISKGLFEIHIFSWEDIVDLIDENRQTYNWYVKNINYKMSKAVKITFQNNSTELVITPKFKKNVIYKYDKSVLAAHKSLMLLDNVLVLDKLFSRTSFSKTEVNHSYSKIYFQIHNIGDDAIEEFKLITKFKGEIVDIAEENTIEHGIEKLIKKSYDISNVFIDKEQQVVKIIPQKKILVGDDTFTSDEFYIKPKSEEYEIEVNWKLISKDFKDEGILKLLVKPEIERKIIHKDVEDPKEVGEEFQGIEDFIETIKEE